jgi:signal transduction histidine kinase
VYNEAGPVRVKSVLHPTLESEVVIHTTASAVRTASEEPASLVVSVFHDVTAAENLEAMRDGFFSAAAHALKTPVAIIKANIQYSARKMPESAMPSYMAIERQCERIDRLVHNLQVVSRARSRSLQIHLRNTDLSPIVVQVTSELKNAKPGLEIRTDIVDRAPVFGDRERLEIAVRNFVYEAVQSARTRAPMVVLLEVRGQHAELRVRYEPLPVAQRPFSMVEEYDDAGLSRCATQTIVEAHGGELGDEEIDEDTAVRWLRLPIMEECA